MINTRNESIKKQNSKSNKRIDTATKATIMLIMVTMLGKVLGFIREMVLASCYGASSYSDAYLVALNIPNVIFIAIGTAISTTFIPMYYESKSVGGNKESNGFTNNIINIVGILSIIISILCLIFTEPIVKIFASGFEGETLDLTIKFTKILVLSLLFISLSEIIKSYLNANDNFVIPGIMMSIPFNIIVIISIFISTKTNPYVIAVGTLLGFFSKFIFQMPYAYKIGYRYKSTMDISDKYIKRTIQLLGPVIIGVSVNQVNAMIDRALASTLIPGSISALNYANRLNNFVLGLFIASISVVIFPILSKLSSENNKENFNECVIKSINSVILLIVPISIGAMILAKPIVTILFQRGAFDQVATDMTSTALIYYSLGLVAFSLREILGKVFYSLQDTRTPMINGALAMILNIILNIILVRYMKHNGLALATSISAIICIILLFMNLNKKINGFEHYKIISVGLKSIVASILMGIVTLKVYKYFSIVLGINFISNISSLFMSVIVGVIVYAVVILILKVEEAVFIINTIKSKIKTKQNEI